VEKDFLGMNNKAKMAMDITGVVVDVVLVTALIPVIVTFINEAEITKNLPSLDL
jgi:hypothetical protein